MDTAIPWDLFPNYRNMLEATNGKKNKTKENSTWLTGQEREQKPQGTESPFFHGSWRRKQDKSRKREESEFREVLQDTSTTIQSQCCVTSSAVQATLITSKLFIKSLNLVATNYIFDVWFTV